MYPHGPTLNTMKQIHIKLPTTLHKQLKVQSAKQDTTIQDYVLRAIKEKLASDVTALNPNTTQTVEQE